MNIYIVWKYDILEPAGSMRWFGRGIQSNLTYPVSQQYDFRTIAHRNREPQLHIQTPA